MEPENEIRFVGMINGIPAFTGKKSLEFNKERSIEKQLDNNEGIAFIRLANMEGFATYGLEQTRQEYYGHGPGYIWASRATAMNKIFDVALVDALYKSEGSLHYTSCAIDLVHAKKFLEGTEYEVNEQPEVTDSDIYYWIRKRDEDEG